MNVIINEDRILKYQLFEAKDHRVKGDWMISFERDDYLILEINEVQSGYYVKNIKSKETKIIELDTDIFAIKKCERDIELQFEFKEGYAFIILCDQKENFQNEKQYFEKDHIVYETIKDGWKAEKISSIELLNANTKENVDFKYEIEPKMYHGNLVDKTLSFRMPSHPVLIRIHYEANPKMGIVRFDSSAIKSLSYENTKNANPYINNVVTNAQYSDDYDFGCEDVHINNFEDFFYQYGKIRVKINLIEKVNLELLLNGEKPNYILSIIEHDVSNGGKPRKVYEYDFKFIDYKESGIISFRLL